MPGGYYNFTTFQSSSPIRYSTVQIPSGGVFKFEILSKAEQKTDNTMELTIQPQLNLPNTLTTAPLLFLEKWREFQLTTENGNPYVRSNSGRLFGPGVFTTWLQDVINHYLTASLPPPPTGQEYVKQYFVSVDHNVDYMGVVIIYPKALPGQPRLQSSVIYMTDIVDPDAE